MFLFCSTMPQMPGGVKALNRARQVLRLSVDDAGSSAKFGPSAPENRFRDGESR